MKEKKNYNYMIRGTVTSERDGQGVANLGVEAWDKDLVFNDFVGSAVTDEQGAFQIQFTESHFKELFLDRKPDLFFKVFKGDKLIKSTENSVLWNVGRKTKDIVIAVKMPDDGPVRKFQVSGRIVEPNGSPLPDKLVKAYDQGIGETELGSAATDDEGHYLIIYRGSQLSDPGKQRANLIVKVFEPNEEAPEAIAASPLFLNAREEETINLVVGEESYRGPSEYEFLREKLDPELKDARLNALTEKDAVALANKTGIAPLEVAYFMKAKRLEEQTGNNISAEIFYGLFRQDLPTSLPALLARDKQVQKSSLEAAASANIINPDLIDQSNDIVAGLQDQVVEQALLENEVPDSRPALIGLLRAAGLSENQQKTLLTIYVHNNKPIEEFWEDVRYHPDFDEVQVKRLQFTLQLGTVSQNHLPLAAALLNREDVNTVRDLAKLGMDDWMEMASNEDIGVPEDTPGDTVEEQQFNFAKTTSNIIEDAFPTPVMAHQLMQDNDFANSNFTSFFSNNPDFEFRAKTVGQYLAENPDALGGIENPEEFRKELEAAQRVFRLTPRYAKFETFKVLWQNNLHSAHQVKRMGSAFVTTYAEQLGGVEHARLIYAKAGKMLALSLMTLAKYGTAFNNISTYVLEPYELPGKIPNGIPNLEGLFGSLDFCECKHCRSVLSPAAYLVDLLEFLQYAHADDGKPVLEKLFERRPDIGNIDLSCENTNAPLPYIDLVNEVLENAVQPGVFEEVTLTRDDGSEITVPVGEVPQTKADAEALKANPEHLNVAAYDELIDAQYPWTLPFNLWWEEARIYLEHLRVPRCRVMEVFRKSGEPPEEIDIACEYLCITKPERDIITGNDTLELHEYYGLDSSDDLSDLEAVEKLLKQTNLTYEELVELLKAKFINPEGKEIIFTDNSCSLQDAALSLNEQELHKLHRFRRLQQKPGWTVVELDKALTALNPSDINDDLIIRLAYIKRLRAQLNVPLVNMLSWWSLIHRAEYEDENSLYEKLFLNETVNTPLESVEDIFKLNATGSDLEDNNNSLLDPDFTPLVLAAINLGADDLSLLVEQKLPTDKLDLPNLSNLYRIATFTKAMNISVKEFLSLEAMSGLPALRLDKRLPDPPDTVSPQESFTFVETRERIRNSDFGIETLDYLLRHQYDATSTIQPSEKYIEILLEDLRAELQKLSADNALGGEDKRESLQDKLSLVLPEELVEDALAIIDGTSEKLPDEQKTFIEDHFAIFLEAEDAKAQLVDPGTLSDKEARFDYILKHLADYLMENLVKQNLATTLDMEVAIVESLLKDHLSHPTDAGQKAIQLFLDESFFNSDPAQSITRDSFGDIYNTFELLYKIAIVINQLNIKSEELEFLFNEGVTIGWLNLVQLPLDPLDSPPASTFEAWKRLVETYDLQKSLFAGDSSIFDLLDMDDATAAQDEILTLLSDGSGWNREDIEYLVGANGCDFTFPDDYKDEQWLLRLRDAFEVIKRIGASAEQVWSWNTAEITFEQARAIKNTAKAKYDNEQWLNIAAPLRDELREKQRDALQAYLVATHEDPVFKDVYSLYEYYLIDTEMSACMMTSRIKQAILAAQLFVQRILMNLEANDGITLDPEDAEEWKWRKNYRVWEANRKVFLYPENWIESELRDDKSPFFLDLENELLQDDVTAETVERVYLNYLRKLDEASRIEISGLYKDEEQNVIHVIGRTPGMPHIYYYRQWVDESYWTPWEKVDVDIEGDHLIPVVHNRRLYLFWPIFKEKAAEIRNNDLKVETEGFELTKDVDPKVPRKFYQIHLAWSEYKHGNWSSKRISNTFVKTGNFSMLPKRSKFYFWAHIDTNNSLIIVPYPYYEQFIFPGFNELDQFRFNGCNNEPEIGKFVSDVLLHGPKADYGNVFMKYKNGRTLELISKIEVDANGIADDQTKELTEILTACVSSIYITIPHQYPIYKSQSPFFYEDNLRTFFVIPGCVYDPYRHHGSFVINMDMDQTQPESPGLIKELYQPAEVIDASGSVANPTLMRGGVFDQRTSETYFPGNNSGIVIDRNVDPDNLPGFDGDNIEGEFPLDIIDEVFEGPEEIPTYGGIKSPATRAYLFQPFYHPYVCLFIKQLNRYGIEGLLNPVPEGDGLELRRQLTPNSSFDFDAVYKPNDEVVNTPRPIEEINFQYGGAYSIYNWELFFHIPLLIATRLSQNQKFAEAQQWFHYIFDPTTTDGDVPQRFWKIKPFFKYDEENSIQELLDLLNEGDEELEKQVEQWEQNPFQLHAIARLRIVAYMKRVVMKYIDNLIAWGDHLFRRDTIESINEATQLYVLAAQILGRRPVRVEGKETQTQTFNDLWPYLGEFGNALVNIESTLSGTATDVRIIEEDKSINALNSILYFCIPRNNKLLSYWDTVADRLFKIRHCMNIEGVVRQLPLFEPPIDPGLLVRAAAAGVDLSSALNDLYAPLPHYRFQYMLQRATELCNDVRSLGAALLSALEKRDAEELALLRAGHEVQLLQAVRQIREKSVDETKETLASLRNAQELAEIRFDYYDTREFMNASERRALILSTLAVILQDAATIIDIFASGAYRLPEFTFGASGFGGSPVSTVTTGGKSIGNSAQAFSSVSRGFSTILNSKAVLLTTIGNYERRADDWNFQADLASKEIQQVEKQIAAAEIRLAIAEKDLENHDLQTENSREVEEFLKDKFTNQELYNWMVTQISSIYFQTYQMAYDLAKRVEKAFQYELAIEETNFIQFGYWDSLKKGLLAGERLHKDLKRMEVAYLDQNKREYELTKSISLVMLDPIALINLKENGECFVNLPEEIFDLDYPGHYMRRLKSVRLTIPCVTGPHTTVNCTLTLERNSIRTVSVLLSGQYKRQTEADGETRFKDNVGAIQSIATSSGQNDSGTFELNFRDERYLPFEGAGAISSWQIKLSKDKALRQFDYDTITDVIMHVSYTAREGGENLKQHAIAELKQTLEDGLLKLSEEDGLLRLFSLKHEFPNKWHRLLHPEGEGEPSRIELDITQKRFPFMFQERDISIDSAFFFLKLKETSGFSRLPFSLSVDGSSVSNVEGEDPSFEPNENGIPTERFSSGLNLGDWVIEVADSDFSTLGENSVEDIRMVLKYKLIFDT